MVRVHVMGLALCGLLVSCDPGDQDASAATAQEDHAEAAAARTVSICRFPGPGHALPSVVHESSGLARGLRGPDLFWTHNDKGNTPDLFAVDESGALVRTVRVTGVPATDWEDIEAGPCGAGSCLYVADIGDNDGGRDMISVHRLQEPGDAVRQVAPDRTIRARFPDGPRDAEALFALPGGELFLVNKGRRHGIALYRFPAGRDRGGMVTLERIRDLLPEPGDGDDLVTAATATPDGRWIGVRTYRTLYVYPSDALLGGGPVEPATVDLTRISEVQGEGLAMDDDGTVWLSSESAKGRGAPLLSRLDCTFPGA